MHDKVLIQCFEYKDHSVNINYCQVYDYKSSDLNTLSIPMVCSMSELLLGKRGHTTISWKMRRFGWLGSDDFWWVMGTERPERHHLEGPFSAEWDPKGIGEAWCVQHGVLRSPKWDLYGCAFICAFASTTSFSTQKIYKPSPGCSFHGS